MGTTFPLYTQVSQRRSAYRLDLEKYDHPIRSLKNQNSSAYAPHAGLRRAQTVDFFKRSLHRMLIDFSRYALNCTSPWLTKKRCRIRKKLYPFRFYFFSL